MGNTLSSFDRLSSREKALVAGLFGGVSGLAILIALVVVSSSLTELEDEIIQQRDVRGDWKRQSLLIENPWQK